MLQRSRPLLYHILNPVTNPAVISRRSPVPLATAIATIKKDHISRTKAKGPRVKVYDEYLKRKGNKGFDESVEVAIRLGLDVRKQGQALRGSVLLPHGTGKTLRVAVFTQNEQSAKEALAAGAVVAGSEDLMNNVLNGVIEFDRAIATPEMVAIMGQRGIARVLGPRGLMPNKKLGTVVEDVGPAVAEQLLGMCQYRTDKTGQIHAGVGKVSFTDAQLMENIKGFMSEINDMKPDGQKGQYIIGGTLSSTQGRGVAMDRMTIDPSNARF
jgi:large subunit ribosomal protein L1